MMALPTVSVSAQLVDNGGNPIVGATVTAMLTVTDYYMKEIVSPAPISAVSDAGGNITLNLWPNVLGTQGSQYTFSCIFGGQTLINGAGAVPNAACLIVDVINAIAPLVVTPPQPGQMTPGAVLIGPPLPGSTTPVQDALNFFWDAINHRLGIGKNNPGAPLDVAGPIIIVNGIAVYFSAGAPSNAVGANGNFYFRSDGAALTTIYQKRAGAWIGIV